MYFWAANKSLKTLKQVYRMKLTTTWIAGAAILLLACNQNRQYEVTGMSGAIVEMNADCPPHREMGALVQSYKTELDREMNVVIGKSARFMDYKRPESLLTNLTADVLKAYGDEHLPNGADIGVMNVHGHRATLPEGTVTVGNLYEIYSFDNAVAFLELKGSDLKRMFDAYARMGGAGISSNVRLVIEGEKVKSVTVDGKPVDNDRIYRIATLDYLADGNDNMSAFRNAVANVNTGVTLRDVMIDWVREQTRQGREIESALDGRITVIN
jgi:2',3'-cyclic-nucleotide 2'-phosphodiesterase (5'-nucleotidase family)